MSAAHLHLVLNHIPVLGTIFGVAILAYGLWRNQDAVVRIALGLFVVAGLGATGAYFTGEGAEEAVEGLAGVSHAAIETHEEIALYAYLLAIVLGFASLGVLVWKRTSDVPRPAAATLLVVGLIAAGILGYTANVGGEIRHSEIRADTPAVQREEMNEND
jgi:hypothetical protein